MKGDNTFFLYKDEGCWFSGMTDRWSYTGGLGQLPSDVDQLVLQRLFLELQLLHGQRLVVVQLHLLVSGH